MESLLRLCDSRAAALQAASAGRRERLADLHRLGTGSPATVGGGPGPAAADGGVLLPHQGGPAATAEVDAAALAATERRLRALGGELTAAREDERRLGELAAEERGFTAGQAEAERRTERAEEFLAGYDLALKELQEERAAAERAADRVVELDTRRHELAGRLDAARRRDALRTAVGDADRALLGLRTAALDAREHALDLERRRLDGMAGELAAGLADGEPCRVCGAAEHPAPALPGADPVTAEDQRRARVAQAAAERAADKADEELTRLRVDEAAATAAAGGRTAAELGTELAAAVEERSAAVRRADGIGAIELRTAQLAAEQQASREQLREFGEAGAAASAGLRALDGERRQLTARLAAVRGDAPSVAARAAQVSALAEAVAAALAAVRAAEEAAARSAEAEREVARAAAEAGFASAREAANALLPAAERTALEARLEAHDRVLAAAEAELARPELAAAATLAPADPARAAHVLAAATGRLQRATSAADEAERRCEALRRLGERLTGLARELGPALDELGRIGRLSALVSGAPGENALRMRLESYVLAARLEQVAAAASERLVRMSGGRYTLVHSDGPVSGTKRSGLSLRVVDAWTGSDRDTATLSGGESFFASLALALGLADVVTDEAGGMPLDTLFIDEGFGSLDEQTLEEVMDVLDGLRERDRSVGIVSHVADLRSRIPSQLVVRKGRHGSTLAVAVQQDV
ncbi:hypothetical protein GCM10025734_65450 [Kitasatospora paranensis]